MWLGLFNLLIKLALEVLRHLERKQIIEQVRVEAAYALIRKANDMVAGLDDIVRSVPNDPDAIMRDSANRANRKPGSGNTN